ncbi:CAP domain-containing protein [Pseudonocardia sp. GCM10023141]|uniref:CAP domain-containing protein n=1 Tax=Pseudonocardia sp. GCM10023141 TaxID=3252653 RepID=UPI0036161DFD
MITFRRHGAVLLSSLATGAVLVGAMTVAPTGTFPESWSTALGSIAEAPAALPTGTPSFSLPTATPTVADVTQAQPAPAAPAQPSTSKPAPAAPVAPPTRALAPPPTTTKAAPPPTTVTAPPPAAPGGALAPAGTAGVVTLTNQERAKAGCAALRRDDRLDTAAQGHSADMSLQSYFSHDSLDGRTFVTRITNAGYPDPGGENIARGQRTAAEVVQAWMNSPGHKRNILDCTFTTIGVGFDQNGDYWTQDFGR